MAQTCTTYQTAKSSYHLGVTSPFPFQQELRDDVHHAVEHAVHARGVEAGHQEPVWKPGWG